jgi:hypothetical protein
MEFVHEFDDSGELRDVVATVALTRDIESTTLVLGNLSSQLRRKAKVSSAVLLSPTLSLLSLSLLA